MKAVLVCSLGGHFAQPYRLRSWSQRQERTRIISRPLPAAYRPVVPAAARTVRNATSSPSCVGLAGMAKEEKQ